MNRRGIGTGTGMCSVVLAAALALSGCSALSGRNVGPTVSSLPTTTTSAPPPAHGRAAFTSSDTVSSVRSAAREDFETIETFDYRDLSKYRRAGLRVTTSPYSGDYQKVFTSKNEAALKRAQTVQVASVDLVGITDLDTRAKTAEVLAHAKLTISSSQTTKPQPSTVIAVLDLREISGKWRISKFTMGTDTHGSVPGNADLRSAISTARTGLAKAFGLRRSHFDSDFAAALKYTTGDLHDQLESEKAELQKKQDDGSYDLSSKVTGVGGIEADGTHAEIFVVVREYRLGREGAKFGPYHLTLDVTMTNPHGTWLLSEAKSVT